MEKPVSVLNQMWQGHLFIFIEDFQCEILIQLNQTISTNTSYNVPLQYGARVVHTQQQIQKEMHNF